MAKKKVNKNSRNRRKKKVSAKSRLIKWFAMLLLFAVILMGVFVFSVFAEFFGPVPEKKELGEIRTSTASEIYASGGEVLGRLYIQNRTIVGIDQIPDHVVKALIATEDSRFYEHDGIDKRSLIRVFFKTLLLGDRSSGGGSTLSQQLIKNLYPRRNIGFLSMPAAKLREAIIAVRLEDIYSKEEILNLYLNTVPFGEGVYGIEEAAKRFFSKPAKRLKLEEGAVLIGMLKANTSYNPRLFPERSLQRRNIVLSQMQKVGYLTDVEFKKFSMCSLGLNYNRVTNSDGVAPYLRERIRQELLKWKETNLKEDGSEYNIYSDGLKIYTTLDYKMQEYAENSMAQHMKKLQGEFDRHWNGREPWEDDKRVVDRMMKRSERYKQLKVAGKSDAEISKIFNTPIEMQVFSWDGLKEVRISPLDSLKHYLQILNTGFLAMNPVNGQVKAWVGGVDHRNFKYDHVTSSRQTGSIFKPLVYLSAIEQGVSPYDYYKNERKVYKEYDNWSPRNAEDHYEGYYTMEGALAESFNTIAVDMIMEAGVDNVIELAREMGVKAELEPYPSLALGTANVSLFEMVQVYACLANGGKRVEPYYLMKIEDRNGDLIEDFELEITKPVRVVSAVNAGMINHMLQGVVNHGTASSLKRVYGLDMSLAGKTGTSQSQTDGWFVGYNSQLVAGVWVGGEDPVIRFRSLTLGQGAHMALPIFARFMQKLSRDPNLKRVVNADFGILPADVLAGLEKPYHRDDMSPEVLIQKLIENPIEEIKKRFSDRPGEEKSVKEKESKIYRFIKTIFKKKDGK
ncbi:MAG: transglycosylase domain-containing protein [Bacteroidales bacterium]|nr:transglycosylase domain-containing protein [Bacteroidales bacterium]